MTTDDTKREDCEPSGNYVQTRALQNVVETGEMVINKIHLNEKDFEALDTNGLVNCKVHMHKLASSLTHYIIQLQILLAHTTIMQTGT